SVAACSARQGLGLAVLAFRGAHRAPRKAARGSARALDPPARARWGARTPGPGLGPGPVHERRSSIMSTFTFRLYALSLEALRAVGVVAAQIARHDPDLARQLRRASTSMHLNIAEGMDAEGRIRIARYRTALGSTNESIA